MIPLNHLRILSEGNHWAIGVGFILPPGIPMGVELVGFEGKEELPQIANYLHEQVMYLYENWDKIKDAIKGTEIPKEFLEAFDEEEG